MRGMMKLVRKKVEAVSTLGAVEVVLKVRRRARPRRTAADRAAAARYLQMLRAGDDTRTQKIRQIRASVRRRAYENDLKLSIALDRLLADITAVENTKRPRLSRD